MRGRVLGMAVLAAVAALAVLPSSASAVIDAKLKRYPYLTDLVDDLGDGQLGHRHLLDERDGQVRPRGRELRHEHRHGDAHLHPRERRLRVPVEGADHRPRRRTPSTATASSSAAANLDLLGTDASPVFTIAGSRRVEHAVQVRRLRRLGQDARAPATRNQANVISQIAAERRPVRASRPATTPTRPAARRTTATSTRPATTRAPSSGPNYWKVAGASLPLFPATGQPRPQQLVLLTNWPQDTAVSTSSGRYQTDNYCCRTARPQRTTRAAGTRSTPGWRASTCSNTAWDDTNVGTATPFKNDFDNHWGPNSPQYQWLKNDLATNPRALRFAFFHYPLDSDSRARAARHVPPGRKLAGGPAEAARRDRRLQRPFAQLPAQHRAAGRNPDAHHRRRRREPRVDRGHGRLRPATTRTGIGWSNTSNVGSACGAGPRAGHEGPRAPLPARERERHVGDGHPHGRAGPDVRPDHLQRARRMTPTCR